MTTTNHPLEGIGKGSKRCQGRRSQPQANFSRTTGAKRPLQGEYRNPYAESCKAISDLNGLVAQVAFPMWESTTKSNKTKGPVAAKATETCVGPSSHPGRELHHPGCNPWVLRGLIPAQTRNQDNPPVVRWPLGLSSSVLPTSKGWENTKTC